MAEETKNLIDLILDKLPMEILSGVIVDRCFSGSEAEKWRYTEWVADKIASRTEQQAIVELVINGTNEVNIQDWDPKIEEMSKGEVNKESWDDLVGHMSMLTPDERSMLMGLKAPVVEFITKEINKLGGVSDAND